MWQRKQTLFLALAVSALIGMIFFPLWKGEAGATTYTLFPLHYTVQSNEATTILYYPYCITAILAVASATLAGLSIKKYNNRMVQLKIGTLNSLLMAGTTVAAIYFATDLIKLHLIQGQYGVSMFMPAVAIVCNMISNFLIRRDEKLVRNSERLR